MILSDTASSIPTDLDRWSDHDLVRWVAARVQVPRQDPADSFILHAPLEVAARAALLPFVAADQRAAARGQLVSLADRYERFGPAVTPSRPASHATAAEHATRLRHALDRGELDDVDRAASALGAVATPGELRALLAPVVVDRLAAAAHAPIFLYHLPRVAPRGELPGELLRGLARELGRAPDWRLHWISDAGPRPVASPDALFDAVAATARVHEPTNTFIYPLMSHVDREGIAAPLLAPVTGGTDIADRGRALLRAAAWTMLREPATHAPYGWSHCLTMPQAVLGIAGCLPDPSVALAVAATYVVGFRSALADVALEPSVELEDPRLPRADAYECGADVAAAAVWHSPADELDDVVGEVATLASTHHDAHLVKYVLACLDAAADDPDHRRLFLAAAASLVGCWRSQADAEDDVA